MHVDSARKSGCMLLESNVANNSNEPTNCMAMFFFFTFKILL